MNNRIKVCEVIPALGVGGAETVVKEWLINLDEKIFDVSLLCVWGRTGSINEDIIEKKRIRTTYLADEVTPFGHRNSILNKAYRSLFINIYIKKHLRTYRPDIIHLHLIDHKTLRRIVSFCKKYNISIIQSVHTDGKVAFSGSRNKEKLKRIIHNNPEIIIAVLNNESKNTMKFIFPNNHIVQINNPVNTKLFSRSDSYRTEVRNELGIPKSAFVVGHVGRFVEVKNHIFILHIFRKLLSEKGNSYLILVGDGELLSTIQRMVAQMGCSDNVIFLSDRDDVYRILNAFDVFVFPSLYEGFPVSLLEAQSVSLKCVVSDKISKDCIVSDKVIIRSLDDDVNKWVDSILFSSSFTNKVGDLKDYDINRVILDLQRLYYSRRCLRIQSALKEYDLVWKE